MKQPPNPNAPLSADALQTLATHFHGDHGVNFLRLRFRFGSPRCVAVGVSFRLVVDLVDEMAQPPSRSLWDALSPSSLRVDLSLACLANLDHSTRGSGTDSHAVTLCSRLVSMPATTTSTRSSSIQWKFDCVITPSSLPLATTSSSIQDTSTHTAVRLQATSSSSFSHSIASPSHEALQSFCSGSQWIHSSATASVQPPNVLILPVISDEIQVFFDPTTTANTQCTVPLPSTSSRCLRMFHISHATSPSRIYIQEDYGHTMGSHIWDASIWLSLALISSCQEDDQDGDAWWPQQMMEVGAGCGLFATVYARLLALSSRQEPQDSFSTMLLTEKLDSVAALRANLTRNGIPAQVATVSPLQWGGTQAAASLRDTEKSSGSIGIGVVFAADVLYHWSTHEDLLATLHAFATAETTTVILAHTHRGVETSRRLEAVVSTGLDSVCNNENPQQNGTQCAWRQWHVERLARVANVDVLRLTKRYPKELITQ